MNKRTTQLLFRAALIGTAGLLAACGGGGDDPVNPPSQTPAPPPPPPAPPTTLQQVTTFLASADALWANAVPNSGAARLSIADDCFLDEGRTKAFNIADIDANLQTVLARDSYRIGETRSNIQILAERNTTNGDGSARREIDVQYDVTYRDGSVAKNVKATLIGGSSFGTPGCTTPQVSSVLRLFGNQRRVRVEVRGRNLRDARYTLTGAARSPAVNYRREVQFFVSDPMGNATYVIVSGPGPTGAGGEPFSFKLISPRLLRSAPELAGKNGNFLNWRDDDAFRVCRIAGGGVPVASVADCVGQGATFNNWGWTTATPDAAADTGFQNQGWTEGGTYTFAVYNDDGWKTVNGHVGRTPLATYTAVLGKLPYTFVEMAGTGPGADNFPRFTQPSDAAQIAANLASANPSPMDFVWSAIPAPADNRAFRLFSFYEFFQGPRSTNTGGAFYPAYRLNVDDYPGSTATALAGKRPTPTLAEMSGKTYGEFGLAYVDRNNSVIVSYASFQ
jgi:hypothetical protein